MQSYLLILWIVAVVFMVIGYINQIKTCPPPVVEYRYIPRTFKEEQENPAKVSEIFNNMFEEPSAWIGGFKFNGGDKSKKIV